MTTIAFGPQLIGQTEKALNALLRRALDDRLSEPQWVTLRLSEQMPEATASNEGLAALVADRARFEDATDLVHALTDLGLVAGGRPTEAGVATLNEFQGQIAAAGGRIWKDLPVDDVDAATRVLNEVLMRAREALD